MNVLRRIAMAVGGTVAVALVIGLVAPKTVHAVVSALVTVANTSANPVAVQRVRESSANFVSVTLISGTSMYNEVQQDGTIGSTPFTIPAGEQFVITDVNWIALCENLFGAITCNKSAGDAVVLVLGGNGSALSPGSYMSQAIYAGNASFGTAGRSDTLKSGLVVTQLPMPSILFGPSGNGENIFAVTLRGYLVP